VEESKEETEEIDNTKEILPKEEKKGEKKKDLIEDAKVAASRIEDANKKMEDLLKKQEELLAKAELGGKAEAGIEPEVPKEETDQEYALKFQKGLVPFKGV